jgi:hypothetical protein
MRYLERRPVRTKLQRKTVTAANIKPETITADEVSFGTAVITTETDLGNVVVDNPKDGLLIVSSTNGSSSVYSGNDNVFIPITDTAAQGSADSAASDAAQAASDAALADAAAQQALDDAAAATAEAVAAQETADAAAAEAQLAFEQAEAAAIAATAAEQDAADSATAAEAAETAALASSDGAAAAEAAALAAETASVTSSEEAAAAAARASAAADEAIASAQAAQDAFDEAEAAAASAAAADAAALAAAESADLAAQEAADAALVAGSAIDEAEAAKQTAIGASESANKKNSVFRAPASAYTAPTYNPPGQPLANSVGDVWFDTTPLTSDVTQAGTAAGGAKPKRWNGTIWEPFGLSYAAITSLDADTITAGTLTGRTVRTSASGNRIELADTDVLKFWKDDATLVGTIQPGFGNEGLSLTAGSGGSSILMSGSGWADDSSIILSTSQTNGQIILYDATYDGEAGGGIFITATNLYMQGNDGWQIRDVVSDAAIYGQGGDISMQGGGAAISLIGGAIELSGDLVLGYGTYVQGTGAPTAAATDGTIIFKYV